MIHTKCGGRVFLDRETDTLEIFCLHCGDRTFATGKFAKFLRDKENKMKKRADGLN